MYRSLRPKYGGRFPFPSVLLNEHPRMLSLQHEKRNLIGNTFLMDQLSTYISRFQGQKDQSH